MRLFADLVGRMSAVFAVIASVLLGAAVLVTCYMMARRYYGYSSYWEVEAAIYMVVAAIFMASPHTLRTGGHVAVDFIPHLLGNGPFGRAYRLLLQLVGMAVCLCLLWLGWHLTMTAMTTGERSISMWRPLKWPLYAMLPMGMGLTALQYLCLMIYPETDEPKDERLPP
jgi:TRAP-type C4-dicarboxylate transport system permease small subunit